MKILIAGYGTVGKAHETYLKPSFDVEIYDPWKGYKDISNNVKAVIICTATPSLENGACLVNSVYDVISRVPNVPILIKSTISLEGWKAIKKDFADHDITFSPEFLRNKTATEDLGNSDDTSDETDDETDASETAEQRFNYDYRPSFLQLP